MRFREFLQSEATSRPVFTARNPLGPDDDLWFQSPNLHMQGMGDWHKDSIERSQIGQKRRAVDNLQRLVAYIMSDPLFYGTNGNPAYSDNNSIRGVNKKTIYGPHVGGDSIKINPAYWSVLEQMGMIQEEIDDTVTIRIDVINNWLSSSWGIDTLKSSIANTIDSVARDSASNMYQMSKSLTFGR